MHCMHCMQTAALCVALGLSQLPAKCKPPLLRVELRVHVTPASQVVALFDCPAQVSFSCCNPLSCQA